MPDDLEERRAQASVDLADAVKEAAFAIHDDRDLAPPGTMSVFVIASACGVAMGDLFRQAPEDAIATAIRVFGESLREAHAHYRGAGQVGCAPLH